MMMFIDMDARVLLEQYFDVAFAAPDGVKRSRELILSLAMRGKLVAQNSRDTPARELLKEIEAEKKQLIKEKKIKKSKPLPEITPEEIPYDLPESWEWVRLSNCYFGIGNKNNQIQTKDYLESGKYPVIDQGKAFISGYCNHKDKLLVLERPIVIFGDHTKNVKFVDFDFVIGADGVKTLCPFRVINTKYLYFTIQSYNIENRGYARHFKLLNEKLLPLPPLEEQHRIVEKIDRLMKQCDRLEKLREERDRKRLIVQTVARNKLLNAKGDREFGEAWDFIRNNFSDLYSVKENVSELRKAILQLAVMGKLVPQDPSDRPASELIKEIEAEKKRLIKEKKIKKSKKSPEIIVNGMHYNLPKNWILAQLDKLLVFGPTNGFSPKAVKHETPFRLLTLSATTSGKFKGEFYKFIDYEIALNSHLWLEDGDILVQRGNTLKYVGVSAIYRGKPNYYIYPDLMMKIRISSNLDTDYIYLAMSSENCREFMRNRASGTSGTMPKINHATLMSLPVPLPPLPEQHRIVAKVDRLMKLCDELEKTSDRATEKQTNLLNALLAKI